MSSFFFSSLQTLHSQKEVDKPWPSDGLYHAGTDVICQMIQSKYAVQWRELLEMRPSRDLSVGTPVNQSGHASTLSLQKIQMGEFLKNLIPVQLLWKGQTLHRVQCHSLCHALNVFIILCFKWAILTRVGLISHTQRLLTGRDWDQWDKSIFYQPFKQQLWVK